MEATTLCIANDLKRKLEKLNYKINKLETNSLAHFKLTSGDHFTPEDYTEDIFETARKSLLVELTYQRDRAELEMRLL